LFCEIFSSEENCVQKLQVPIFKIIVSWRPKKVPKVPVFFGLEGTLLVTPSQSKMPLQCSRNRDEYKQSVCIKSRNRMLFDFLHLSGNR